MSDSIRYWGKFEVLVGELAPRGVAIVLATGGLISDMTDVASVELRGIEQRSETPVTWSTTITAQTTSELTAVHLFEEADTSALRQIRFAIWVLRTGDEHPIQCGVFDLQVRRP